MKYLGLLIVASLFMFSCEDETPTPLPIANTNPADTVELVELSTSYGMMVVYLYDKTPLHKKNFIKLANQGFYDGLLFHRVIPNFMIQGGNSDRDNTYEKMKKIGNYTIPEEIKSNHFHKSGALAMAVSEQLDIAPELRTKNSGLRTKD